MCWCPVTRDVQMISAPSVHGYQFSQSSEQKQPSCLHQQKPPSGEAAQRPKRFRDAAPCTGGRLGIPDSLPFVFPQGTYLGICHVSALIS